MKKQISRLFLAVFMITALLFCMNMTAFAAAEATFTGNETDFSASVNMGNTSVDVIVHDEPKTDINVGDKLIVTGDRDDTILNNNADSVLDEAEFVDVISHGSMSVKDDNGEKVVHTTADINTNMIPLDYDTDGDGSITTYVTQTFNQSQLSGVMGANQTQDLIFKSQLANPGAGEDKDPEVTVINKNQIQAVGGGYTVTVSFDGIRNWIFGLVNHVISMDYNMHEIKTNEEMTQKGINQDINLLMRELPEGGCMFGMDDDGAKLHVVGTAGEYYKRDAAGNIVYEQMQEDGYTWYEPVVNEDGAAEIMERIKGMNLANTRFSDFNLEKLRELVDDAADEALDSNVPNAFLVMVMKKGDAFDGCKGGYFYYEANPFNHEDSWNYGCYYGGVTYGEDYYNYGVAANYHAYTMNHAELTAEDIIFELKDKELIYLPGGEKNFTLDDVELYFIDEDGNKIDMSQYSDFIDCHMSGKDSDGTISVCVGGIYKTINLCEQPKPFFITPSTVSYLIKTGYYPGFLSNENASASFTIDFAQDAAHPENNTIYITAEPNADGKFEPTTMQFNSTLIRHLTQALVNTVSLTVGDNEVVISYASVAELVKKYDGASFSLTVDGDKVTAVVMNKLGIVTDVTSELKMTVNKK